MKTMQRTTAVGVFTDHAQVDRAVADLKRAGFRDDQIGVAGRDWRDQAAARGVKQVGTEAEEGAAIGAAVGAGAGALVGLGILAGFIPVLGPIIAGGPLAVILANAAGGAVIVGIAGALVGLGIPEEEAQFYEAEFKAGRYIVTVKCDGRHDEALAILRRHGAWDRSTAPALTAGEKMQLTEEELHPHKHQEQAGEVHVRKEVQTEHRTLDVPVQREEVVVERHPATGQPAARSDLAAGQEIRIPVKEEHVHVEKTPVVKEEVSVGKRQVQGTEHVGGTVRKEELRVEKEGDVEVRQRQEPKR